MNFSFFADNAINRPQLLRGYGKTLPAFKKWTDKFLQENLESMSGFVETAQNSIFNPSSPYSSSGLDEDMAPAEFIKKYIHNSRRKEKLFLAEFPISENLLDDIKMLEFVNLTAEYRKHLEFVPLLYLGKGGNFTPLHHDDYENLYIVLDGEKEVDIISNVYDELLADYVEEGNHLSLGELSNQALIDNPILNNIVVEKFHLASGDALYIPKRFWHSMRGSKDRNLAVSIWF